MSTHFIYSILQYHHSAASPEALNIGILFHFPEAEALYFMTGDVRRIKYVYPNIDKVTLLQYLRLIEIGVKKESNLAIQKSNKSYFTDLIYSKLLKKDDSALQFTPPTIVTQEYSTVEKAVKTYTNIFLPNNKSIFTE